MKGCVATVGTFDGVHRGHMAIIDELLRQAADRGLDSLVITFNRHPLEVIAPAKAPRLAVARGESAERLRQAGVSEVSQIDFTPELARLRAREFIRLVRERYNVAVMVMGFDNSFGSDRLASHDDYIRAADDEGVELMFVDPVYTPDGQKISSSLMRKAVAAGDLGFNAVLSQWPVTVSGTVERGKRNGHKLGFPTVNIRPDEGVESLPTGVYAARWASDMAKDGGYVYGVLNIGHNPTIAEGNKLTYEFHAPGVDLGERYGQPFRVEVLSRLRGEKKFGSLDELKAAISADIKELESRYGLAQNSNEPA